MKKNASLKFLLGKETTRSKREEKRHCMCKGLARTQLEKTPRMSALNIGISITMTSLNNYQKNEQTRLASEISGLKCFNRNELQ